jgi:hypothetical protein
MERILAISLAAAVLFGSAPVLAGPCVDVGISFEPDVAVPHDRVTLSAFIANTGDEAGLVDLAITVEFNEETFGPLETHIHLRAGKEIAIQLMLPVPPRLAPGTLSITLDAAAGECEDSATATLTIEEGEATGEDSPDLKDIGTQLLLAFVRGTTPTRDTTWGSLKHRYQSSAAIRP